MKRNKQTGAKAPLYSANVPRQVSRKAGGAGARNAEAAVGVTPASQPPCQLVGISCTSLMGLSNSSNLIPNLVKESGLEKWNKECPEAFTKEGKLRISLNQNSLSVLSSPDGRRVELTPDNWNILVGDRLEVEFYSGQAESRESVLLAIQEKLDRESHLCNSEEKLK